MTIDHDLTPTRPDYAGGSIVNLMASIGQRFEATTATQSATLRLLHAERLADARRVALVVIDGLGAELLQHVGPHSALAEHLAGTMTSVYPPTTASAITSIMSGLAPQQHGLTGWFMHFRHLGAVTAVLPFMPRFTPASIAAAGVEPAALIDAPSFSAGLNCETLSLLPHELADSAYSRLLGAGSRRDGYRDLADFAARVEAFCRGDEAAGYLYAYWPGLDHTAHIHGPSAAAVAAHFHALDAALAPLTAVAAAHGTLLLVTADHGFIDSGADERIDLADHPALADMLTLPLCGEPRSAYAYVRPARISEFEHYVRAELGHAVELHRTEDFIDAGWFGPGAAHPELAARAGDYVLCMRERYTLRDRVVGERDVDLRGMHGGLTAAEQLVPLIAAGP